MMQNTTSHQPLTKLARVFRAFAKRRCQALQAGHLVVNDADGQMSFGEKNSDLKVVLDIHNPRFYRRVGTEGDLGIASALIDGDFSCNDLTALVRLFIRNLNITDQLESPGGRIVRRFRRLGHWLRRNTIERSKKNIAAHYDLGDDFYSLWLDSTMNYSSGIFQKPSDTLQASSIQKMDRLCRRLDLKPSDHLLEIGTGWGALACFAAQHYGCRVTTTTISDQQFARATQRVQRRNLQDQVTVLKQDYRLLEGENKFDKIVSVEMIEAVGHQYYPVFFEQCQKLLAQDGLMMMQAITIADHRYESHLRNVDFIGKYIFPGGSLPSISCLTGHASVSAGMRLLELVDITPHYAETLRRWRDNFMQNLPAIRDLGYDSEFIRMWEYYLCYCEAGFEERQINTVQMMFAKPACRVDPITQLGEIGATQIPQPATAFVPRPTSSDEFEDELEQGAETCRTRSC